MTSNREIFVFAGRYSERYLRDRYDFFITVLEDSRRKSDTFARSTRYTYFINALNLCGAINIILFTDLNQICLCSGDERMYWWTSLVENWTRQQGEVRLSLDRTECSTFRSQNNSMSFPLDALVTINDDASEKWSKSVHSSLSID